MKIAVFHELPIGGARRAVNEISHRLKKHNVVDLYVVDEKKNLQEQKYFTNVFFYKFISKKWAGKNWQVRIYKDTIELLSLYFLHKKIAEDVRNRRYNLLMVNASRFIESPFLLRFPNARKVFYCHDPYYRLIYESQFTFPVNLDPLRKMYERVNRFIRKTLDRQNFYGADLLLANSKYTRKKIKEIYKRNSTLAYLGVDHTFFTPTNIRKEFDVCFIGTTYPIDGYSLFKEALSYIHPKPTVINLFTNKQWLDDIDLRNTYRKSKIVVCLAHKEPFGLIPLEAMACGVPVIAVNEGGYKESIINGKTGYLIRRRPQDLADSISKLLKDDTLRRKMKEASRRHIEENWTWEKSVKRLSELIVK